MSASEAQFMTCLQGATSMVQVCTSHDLSLGLASAAHTELSTCFSRAAAWHAWHARTWRTSAEG
jgi:hypothetical protein